MLARMRGKRSPHTLLVGPKASTTTRKTVWRLLRKLEIDLLYDPATPSLGYI
jgi:hypothetical protein